MAFWYIRLLYEFEIRSFIPLKYQTLASMEEFRMLIVHVELDSRRLGGSLSLIPFADA